MARDLREKLLIAKQILSAPSVPQLVEAIWPDDQLNDEKRERYISRFYKWLSGKSSSTRDKFFANSFAKALGFRGSSTSLLDSDIGRFCDLLRDEIETLQIDLSPILGEQLSREAYRLPDVSPAPTFDDLSIWDEAYSGNYVSLEPGREYDTDQPVMRCHFYEVGGVDPKLRCIRGELKNHPRNGLNYPLSFYVTEQSIFIIVYGDNARYPPFFLNLYKSQSPVSFLFGVYCASVPLEAYTAPTATKVLLVKVPSSVQQAPKAIPHTAPFFANLFELVKNEIPNDSGGYKLTAEVEKAQRIRRLLEKGEITAYLSKEQKQGAEG